MIYSKEFELKPQEFKKFPLDWSKIFNNNNPIHVEIGFGNGEFAEYYTNKYKNINYVGFEVSITSMVKAQKRLKKINAKNAKLILCDAKFGLREFFSPNLVEKVIMNFPIPWYKNSQSHKRMIVKDFFYILSDILVENGVFELLTDQEWYAKEAYENAKNTGYFQIYEIEKNPKREFLTRYEQKWIRFKRDIFRFTAKKIKQGHVNRIIGGINNMPHAVGKINEEKIYTLKNKVFKENEKVFIIKNIYKELNSQTYILKIVSSDNEFTQHYFLVLYPKKETNEWVIKLDSESNPYRTPAVKWSVKKIMEVLK